MYKVGQSCTMAKEEQNGKGLSDDVSPKKEQEPSARAKQLAKCLADGVSPDPDTGIIKWPDGCVTCKATPAVKGEQIFSFGKTVLNLYLALLFFVWWDSFGVWFLPLMLYLLALLVPVPLDGWNFETRMEVRSLVIINMTLLSVPVVLIWCVQRGGRLGTACLALYIGWAIFLDDAAHRGGRFFPSLRRRNFWRHAAAYFPMSLTKTAELDPKKKYLFGYHPHGIIGIGAMCNFATDATSFSSLFPGIDLRLLTLEMNFKIPFFREYLLGMGVNGASRESCEGNLKRGPGAAVMLVVGGARESLEASPGRADLVLGNRKGFIKVAIKAGASLVPVFSFGENDVYGVYHAEGMLRRIQLTCQKRMGFALPFFFGRALTGGLLHRLFGLNVGIMPLRVPVNSVVGKPIDVKQNSNPTNEEIDRVHAEYLAELSRIYEDWVEVWKHERGLALTHGDKRRLEVLKDSRFHLDDASPSHLAFLD